MCCATRSGFDIVKGALSIHLNAVCIEQLKSGSLLESIRLPKCEVAGIASLSPSMQPSWNQYANDPFQSHEKQGPILS